MVEKGIFLKLSEQFILAVEVQSSPSTNSVVKDWSMWQLHGVWWFWMFYKHAEVDKFTMRDSVYGQASTHNILWTEVVRAAGTLILDLGDWGLQAFQLLFPSTACPLYCADFYVTSTETAAHLLTGEAYEHWVFPCIDKMSYLGCSKPHQVPIFSWKNLFLKKNMYIKVAVVALDSLLSFAFIAKICPDIRWLNIGILNIVLVGGWASGSVRAQWERNA